MMRIVLVVLQILFNMGLVGCMCVGNNILLYLVEFLGFLLSDKYLK